MAVNILSINEIISDPNVRAGRPVIAGTGIRVMDIVAYHLYGDKLSAEQIAEDFQLSLAQVYAALSYYYSHQDEIDEQMQADAQEAARMREDLKKQGRLLE